MIWAILPDVSSTETLLNNLSEADFDLDEVSVIMQDNAQRDVVAKDIGPLQGVELKTLAKSLIKLGLSEQGAESCRAAVINGQVLVVMDVPAEYLPAATEMFEDHSARLIKG
jgi:hypothetical protein